MPMELMAEKIEKAQAEIEKRRDKAKEGKMRQRYHFMAEQGWLNDPNGLIYYQDKYHYFYQYNPYDSFWGAMHWGHAVSEDLLEWKYLPIALAPSESYDNHEKGGCFSGSAIEYDGKLYLLYTGTSNDGDGFEQSQCVAYSEDGIHFEKYSNNPVITAPDGYDKANFRDPKVWRHGEYFYLICSATKDHMAKALLYRSPDLIKWEYVNVLAESRGELGYMWECPDLYQLEDKYVLMFSPMGLGERTTVYLVGDLDYDTGKFDYTVSGEIDWGFDFYAPQSFQDKKGRRIIVGWANAWDWMPWWKDWGPTYKEGWCGSFGIPREIRLCEDHTLQFIPVEELRALRQEERQETELSIGTIPCRIEAGDGVAWEMKLEIDLKQTTAEVISLYLRCHEDKKTVVTVNLKDAELFIDRNKADGWSHGISRSILKKKDKKTLEMHLYMDQSSLELFTDNYKTVHSLNLFAGEEQNQNYVKAEDGLVHIKRLSTWGIRTVM